MINLTRINHLPLVLNSDLIEHIERTPDTVVSLTSGLKLLVLESPDEIIEKVIEFRRSILAPISNIKKNSAELLYAVPTTYRRTDPQVRKDGERP
jgi:flagellar protein FlbD